MRAIAKINARTFLRRVSHLAKNAADLKKRTNNLARVTFEFEAKKLVSNRLLKVRSGKLRNSIEAGVRTRKDGLLVYVGVRKLKYAPAQELGATIRPKRAKFLAIPLKPARTRAGVARWPSPRDCPRKLYFDKETMTLRESRTGKAYYALKKRVRLKEKAFLRTAVKNKIDEFVKMLYNLILR